MAPFGRLMIAAAAVLALAGCDNAGGGATAATGEPRTIGKANAPVKVIEYASTSCGHCAVFNNEEFPKFKAQYIDSGKVFYEMREILTDPAAVSAAGFRVAECSGKGKYFETIDAIFHSDLPFARGNPSEDLLRIAKEAGMSEAAYKKCIGDEDALKSLRARVEQNSTQVTGTPTFFINGVKYEGPPTTAALGQAVDASAKK